MEPKASATFLHRLHSKMNKIRAPEMLERNNVKQKHFGIKNAFGAKRSSFSVFSTGFLRCSLSEVSERSSDRGYKGDPLDECIESA